MYCPRCSQKQLSDEVKFCSRCGFLLSDVAEALQNDGLVERNVIQPAQDVKKDTLIGILLMALSAGFALLSLIFGTPEPNSVVQLNLLIGLLVFLFGMALIAYSFWLKPYFEFGREVRKSVLEDLAPDIKEIVKEAVSGTKPNEKQLKEPDLSQVVSYVEPQKSYTTSDLTKTPSVIEETTKNLRFDEK